MEALLIRGSLIEQFLDRGHAVEDAEKMASATFVLHDMIVVGRGAICFEEKQVLQRIAPLSLRLLEEREAYYAQMRARNRRAVKHFLGRRVARWVKTAAVLAVSSPLALVHPAAPVATVGAYLIFTETPWPNIERKMACSLDWLSGLEVREGMSLLFRERYLRTEEGLYKLTPLLIDSLLRI